MADGKGGLPISVVVRIRPPVRGETSEVAFRFEGGLVQAACDGKRGEAPCDRGFSADAKTAAVADALGPLLRSFVDGVNVCLIVAGETTAGKTYTVDGSGKKAKDGEPGLIHHAITGAYKLVDEKARKFGATKDVDAGDETRRRKSEFKKRVRIQHMEVYNEKIIDLFDVRNTGLEVDETEDRGVHVRGLSSRSCENERDTMDAYSESRGARTTEVTEFGPAAARATAIFHMELSQTVVADEGVPPVELQSRMTIVDLAGLEQLAEDPQALRLREGPMLNRSILAFGNVVKALAAGTEFVNYQESTVTSVLQDELGGNCITMVMMALRPINFTAAGVVFRLARQLGTIRSYPVLNDARVRGLMRKWRVVLLHAKEEARAGGGTRGGDPSLYRIHDLEGHILQDNVEKVRLKEEREKMATQYQDLLSKYEEAVEARTKLQEDLLGAEEEKLKVSKALIDLKIENNQLVEAEESKNFELVNRVLTLENDLMQYEMKGATRDKVLHDMKTELEQALEDKRDLELEYVALKTNFVARAREIEEEQRKNQELGLELLNLVNANNALKAELVDARGRGDAVFGGRAREAPPSGRGADERELRRLERKVRDLEEELAEARKREPAPLPTAGAGDPREARRLDRKVRELEEELADARRDRARIDSDNDALKEKIEELTEAHRKKIKQYMQEMSDAAKTLGRYDDAAAARADRGTARAKSTVRGFDGINANLQVQQMMDSLVKDYVATYSERDREQRETLAAMRTKNKELTRKHQVLAAAYRTLKQQVEESGPRGQAAAMLSERDLKGTAPSEVERSLESEVGTLNTKVTKLEGKVTKLQEESLAQGETNQKLVYELQHRNATIVKELEALRLFKKAAEEGGGGDRFSKMHDDIVAKLERLDHLPGEGQTEELIQLRRENMELRNQVKQNAAAVPLPPVGGDKMANEKLRQMLREFTSTTQATLEAERSRLLARATMAEEQLHQLQMHLQRSRK